MSLTRVGPSFKQQTSASRLGWRRRDGGDTQSWEKDKYLSGVRSRAFLFGPPLEQFERLLGSGRQKMPVSRCARLKNDRRGAEPDSTALSPSLFLSLSLFPSCSSHHPRARDPPRCRVIPLPRSRRRRRSFPLRHSKIETHPPHTPRPFSPLRRSNVSPWSFFFFYGILFFSAFN